MVDPDAGAVDSQRERWLGPLDAVIFPIVEKRREGGREGPLGKTSRGDGATVETINRNSETMK